jgi:dTDP-4-dehydrorhamnose reductase
MLGRDVVAAALSRGHEAIGLDRQALDIADEGAVAHAVADAHAEIVVNCAAWTDVDGAETDEAGAARVNATGAGNVAVAASSTGARTVHVSTDYVFDGRATRPYVETDPVGPASAYGRTKLAGEQAVAAGDPRALVVRTSWLFGLGGRNFVATMLGLAQERDEVSVVTDQVGCPTYTGHLAVALLELAEERATGIRHVAGAGSCSWNELAKEVFRQAGLSCRVQPASSAEMARPAPRPAMSALVSEHPDTPLLAPWAEGVAAYLAERASSDRAEVGA